MRISPTTCLLAALCSTSCVRATQLLSTPTPTTSHTGAALDDLIPTATPFPGTQREHGAPHLDIRQGGLGIGAGAGATPNVVPVVTIYSIVSQVGATGVQEVYTYTQTFAAVPDQFPVAKRGTVGYGTLQRRDAEPTAVGNTGYDVQSLVLAMETVLITRHLRRVTEVVVVETRAAHGSIIGANQTRDALNYTLPASLATGGSRGLYTASGLP